MSAISGHGAHLRPEDGLSPMPPPGGRRVVELLRHGTLLIEVYAPRGVDPQQPHMRDEVYVIISGTGLFFNGSDRRRFAPGDLLFVPAGCPHRFEEFSDDFATWVMFYGPEGGER